MKIVKVDYLVNKNPIELPEPWMSAWNSPGGHVVKKFYASCYKVYTDTGLIGYGPFTGAKGSIILNRSPFAIDDFFRECMSGDYSGKKNLNASGLEVAMWDLIGKEAKLPLYKVFGSSQNKKLVYASTSRLLPIDELVNLVMQIKEEGFKAIKIRLHREKVSEDIRAAEAVRKAVGDDFLLMADANQNNKSIGYQPWDRATASNVIKALEDLKYYCIEDPLPMKNYKDVARFREKYSILISGGEHAETIHDYKSLVNEGAYDIYQPDISLRGNFGLTGMRKVLDMAEYNNLMVIPHIPSYANVAINVTATMHVAVTSQACKMVEYPYDPPILTCNTTQSLVKDKLTVDDDGCMHLSEKPGLGIEYDESVMQVVDTWQATPALS